LDSPCERVTEVETVFGQIKHNQHFHTFMLRGLEKTTVEWGCSVWPTISKS
jgi:hypothetical protein